VAAYSELTDAELIDLLREDDSAAFAEIYARFFGLLYIFVHRKLKDEDDAKDILQELFANIWDKRQTLNFTGTLNIYLYAAVRNRMLDRTGRKDVEDRYIQSLQSFMNEGYSTSDHRIREKQLASLIEKEIDALPAKMREVFLLSRRDHLTYKQIAEKLDLSEQTVRSHVKHALRTLRVRLGLLGYAAMLIKIFLK
jgi:RNA polymerase sigma-70 factor (family 1)